MVERERAHDVNEAARRFAETLEESYRVVYGQAAESQERQRRLAQGFSELVATNLREQTEGGRAAAERLSEQAKKQEEAGQALARESVEAYVEFLDTAFSRYRSGTARAAENVQEGAIVTGGTAARVVGAATGAVADATASTLDTTAETAAFPIAGYDEMNVEEVSKRLNDLSVEELQLVRDYEERNKRRDTLLEQMDRKIRAT
jgi:hypothetical protein